MVHRKWCARLGLYVIQDFCGCGDACGAWRVWQGTSNPPWVRGPPARAAAPCSCSRRHSWSWSACPTLSATSLPSCWPVTPPQKHSPTAARQSAHTRWEQPSRTGTGLWQRTDITFHKTVSHFIYLNVQDCNLSRLPIYFHYCDLLWLILIDWHQSTWLVSWIPTLSCYCDLFSEQWSVFTWPSLLD